MVAVFASGFTAWVATIIGGVEMCFGFDTCSDQGIFEIGWASVGYEWALGKDFLKT